MLIQIFLLRRSLTLLLFAFVVLPRCGQAAEEFDVVIKGGRIVDGSGAPWFVADIGIVDDKITRIGRIEEAEAKKVLSAEGLIVAPGFIDMMGQSASPLLEDPKSAINLLTQGITTINAGEGGSAAPLSAEVGERQGWTTLAEYFALLELRGLPINMVQTVGHTQIRRIVLGDVERRPSDEELAAMQELVHEAMRAGAIGVSTALIYPPAVYAQTKEIAALSSVAGQYGGKYFTHMRNEGDKLLEAIDEAIEIGREAETPVHIFHLKAAGQQNWGKMQLAIARIKAARSEGYQVTADIYPYVHNGLGIAAMIHPRHFGDGYDALRERLSDAGLRAEIRKEMEETEGWENWFRHVDHDWDRIIIGQSEDPHYHDVLGKSVAVIAKAKGEDVWETFFRLASRGAFALPQSMTDANKIMAMQQPFVSFCTDVGPSSGGRSASHPRGFGSIPRLLSRYVRDLGAISLERAVAQGSAAAANVVLCHDRGRIAEGLAADLIVFDFQGLADRADFSTPDAVSEGMRFVIVNGKIVLEHGEFTGATPGRVLRGPGYDADRSPHSVSTGTNDRRLQSFDKEMKRIMKEHRIPGAAIAVTDHGRLVYAKGFGYGDLANAEKVEPESLFRIASISKPITAVAILQLVERDELELNAPVFDILDHADDIAAAGDKFDPRNREITIRHLLQHRGGWDRGKSFDAMFQAVRFAEQMKVPAPANQETVIRAMFSHPLDFDPGQQYAYSNFGYCLLGRVIEEISGMPYEQFVKENVLSPLGIHSMRLGATRLDGRAEKEVRYYHPDRGTSVFASDLGQRIPSAYGAWNLEVMDSHGGWLASAVDLARFAAAFDDPERCPILTRRSIELMYERPPGLAGHDAEGAPKPKFYSLGWSNRTVGQEKTNRWHSGSLPGTATIMIRRHDGKNFVALLNSRASARKQTVSAAIESMLHSAANAVEEWPEADLFEP